MKDNDNDTPAFPGGMAGHEYGDHAGEPMNDGMTLRDWFAGMVLQGQLASQNECKGGKWIKFNQLATVCYEIANEMLKARSQWTR
jgi:hypothetical protein